MSSKVAIIHGNSLQCDHGVQIMQDCQACACQHIDFSENQDGTAQCLACGLRAWSCPDCGEMQLGEVQHGEEWICQRCADLHAEENEPTRAQDAPVSSNAANQGSRADMRPTALLGGRSPYTAGTQLQYQEGRMSLSMSKLYKIAYDTARLAHDLSRIQFLCTMPATWLEANRSMLLEGLSIDGIN